MARKTKQCAGRRPNGDMCPNLVPPGNKAFCDRCDGEIFKKKVATFSFEDIDRDKPNSYEPEPVEMGFQGEPVYRG